MLITPEISSCSIVMLGEFNPAIFHPTWLEVNKIEHDVQGENTNIEVVHRDLTVFNIDTRAYNITPMRFSLETTTAPWVSVLDIVRQIFEEFLIHTPIRAFGVNFLVHVSVRNAEIRNKITSVLAPIEPWAKFGEQMNDEVVSPNISSGLTSLTMTRIKRIKMGPHDALIRTNSKVEPSVRIENNKGLFLEINHHHDLSQYKPGMGTKPALALLCEVFEDEIREAGEIIDTIVGIQNAQ